MTKSSVDQRTEYVNRLRTAIPLEMQNMQRFCFCDAAKNPYRVERTGSSVIPVKGVKTSYGVESLCTLKEACNLFLNGFKGRGIEGIGFYFWENDGLFGIDLDKVLHPELKTHIPKESREKIKAAMAVMPKTVYAEKSVSGHGCHFIGKASPVVGCKPLPNIELYSKGRFFYLTGVPLFEFKANGALRDISAAVEILAPLSDRIIDDIGNAVVLPPIESIEGGISEGARHATILSYSLKYTNDLTRSVADIAAQIKKDLGPKIVLGGRISDEKTLDLEILSCVRSGRAKVEAEKKMETAAIITALEEGGGESLTGSGWVYTPPKKGVKRHNFKMHPLEVALAFYQSTPHRQLLLYSDVWWSYSNTRKHWSIVADTAEINARLRSFIFEYDYDVLPEPGSKKGPTAKSKKDGDEGKGADIQQEECKKTYKRTSISSQEFAELRLQLAMLARLTDRPRPDQWLDWENKGHKEEIIPFKNCLLDSVRDSVMPHDSSFFNTSVLPFDYDPSATCPVWEQALKDWFHDEPWCADMLELSMATCFAAFSPLKYIHVLYGLPNSGKSTVTRVLAELVGSGYTKAANSRSIVKDFGMSMADQKKLLVLDDMSLETISSTCVDVFKEITSGAESPINSKFKEEITMVIRARVFITTNSQPWMFKDPGGGLTERFIFFNFERLEGRVDHRFQDKLLAELPGIFNRLYRALRRLHAGERPSQPKGRGAQILATMKSSGTPLVDRFFENHVRYDCEGRFMSSITLFEHYMRYCESMSEAPIPNHHVGLSRYFNSLLERRVVPTSLLGIQKFRESGGGLRGFTNVGISRIGFED